MKFGFKSTARNAAMALVALLAVTIGMSGTSHACPVGYDTP